MPIIIKQECFVVPADNLLKIRAIRLVGPRPGVIVLSNEHVVALFVIVERHLLLREDQIHCFLVPLAAGIVSPRSDLLIALLG